MPEQPGPEFDVDTIGRMREKIGLQGAEEPLGEGQDDKAADQHVQGAQAVMRKHLVDHDLEKQRRRQREELQNERRGEHLEQKPAVFVNGAEKPRDVKAAVKLRERRTAGHQNQPTVPYRFEFASRHGFRLRRSRVLH